jgi:hypothetical protein
MTFLRALKYELIKNLRKKRTFWAFVAIAALVSILLVGYTAMGWNPVTHYAGGLSGVRRALVMEAVKHYENGALFATLIMGLLSFALMPVLAVAFGSELISSEIQLGTLRTALVRPVTRLGYYMTKYAYAAIITLGFVLFTALFTYGLGVAFLGRGPLLAPAAFLRPSFAGQFEDVVIHGEATAFVRYLVAYLLVALAVMTMTTLSFTLSTVVKHTGELAPVPVREQDGLLGGGVFAEPAEWRNLAHRRLFRRVQRRAVRRGARRVPSAGRAVLARGK